MQAGFEVIHGGMLSLVQDRGRFGFNAMGVTQSGVMDEYAYFWANKLLNNDLNSNVLEILWTHLAIQATAPCVMSVTGADVTLCINGKQHKPWQSFNIQAGDVVGFTKTVSGQRAYLAVKGGFKLEKIFDSYSTTIKESLGLFEGRKLQKGDFLPFESTASMPIHRLKEQYQPDYKESLTLRVVMGYQEAYFTKEAKETFFSNEYTVTNENNRMAIKLNGTPIECDRDGIISEGISFGAIQIPKDGQPIVLLKERQTIGGYPKIGSVLSLDCFKLSQVKPNSTVRFKEISLQEAQQSVRAFYSAFK